MSFIEGIGDDFLYAFLVLLFIGTVSLAWLSTHVNSIPLPTTLFVIERRTHRRNEEEELERASPAPSPTNEPPTLSANETLTEHESDMESSESDEFTTEQIVTESNLSPIQPLQSISPSTSIDEEDQSLRITIKFLNETQKSILAHPNDTISKIKRLYFADELANHKIVRFIYQGRELKDPETLRRYNIRDETIIHCQISIRRHSTPNRTQERITAGHLHPNGFDTSSFLDASPLNIPLHFILLITLILGSIWYLRIKYRVLFTPISTIILILITIIFLIFTCGPVLTARRHISNTRTSSQLQHVHLE